VEALAVDSSAGGPETIVVGTQRGVYRATDPMRPYDAVSDPDRVSPSFRERVTLPPTWLFASGQHEVEVLSEDRAAGSDADR
jgi:hypothetical protein